VTFNVTGANPQTGTALANGSGVAAFTYSAVNSGTDTVVATANVGGTPLTSNPGSVTWVRAEPHSLSIAGASSFAESPARADLNLTGNWTVELWLRDEDPNGFDHEYRHLINRATVSRRSLRSTCCLATAAYSPACGVVGRTIR
jgi:hypothetical protein